MSSALKKLKRKRELRARVKCHGTVFNHLEEHKTTVRRQVVVPKPPVEIRAKQGLFSRVFNKMKIWKPQV